KPPDPMGNGRVEHRRPNQHCGNRDHRPAGNDREAFGWRQPPGRSTSRRRTRLQLVNLRRAERAVAGGQPGPEGNVTKLLRTEILQHGAALAATRALPCWRISVRGSCRKLCVPQSTAAVDELNGSGCVDPDALFLEVLGDAVCAEFLSEAAHLVTAERDGWVELGVGVDPHDARLQGAG